jgi:hypothetical protein
LLLLVTAGCSSDGSRGVTGARGPGPDAGGATGSPSPDGASGVGIPLIEEGCAPPEGATALCLTFAPEEVTPEDEPGLDQRGFFRIQVFDTPRPPFSDGASSGALYDRTVTGAGVDGELALRELPEPTVVLDDPPPVVFVRALFFDNGGITETGGIDWGTWLGGLDVSGGLSGDTAVAPFGELEPPRGRRSSDSSCALSGALERHQPSAVSFQPGRSG